jgi:hypothetical protein
MSKVSLRIVALVFGGACAAGAAVPRVAATYELRAPQTPGLIVAATSAAEGPGVAVLAWTTFEGTAYAGTLAVMGEREAPFELSGVWSAAPNSSWDRVVVGEQLEVVDNTVTPPYERTSGLCRELKIGAAELKAALYYDPFVGNGYVTRPVIYDLDSDGREPLPAVGGDFVDWAGEERLILGRETSGSKEVGLGTLALFGYNLANGVSTPLAAPEVAVAKLGDRLSPHMRNSPYLAAPWRLVVPEGVASSAAIAAPARGGAFENLGGRYFWRPEGGEAAFVGEGAAVAASADGSWVVVYRAGALKPLEAVRFEWR